MMELTETVTAVRLQLLVTHSTPTLILGLANLEKYFCSIKAKNYCSFKYTGLLI